MTLDIVGDIVRDHDVVGAYPQGQVIRARALLITPNGDWSNDPLVIFLATNVILSSCFVPIDPRRRWMLLNQSYTGIASIFATRFKIDEGRFSLTTDPVQLAGGYVILGGPIDGVWYHWLFNWCPRLLLVRMLRPDLLKDPNIRFLVHPCALQGPFKAVLDTFGIADERFVVADPERDYRIERAYIVSFFDHLRLYPDQIRAFADHLLSSWNLADEPATPGVFASRQALPPPKRRIHNFGEIEPVLRAFSLTVTDCGALSAQEQARRFRAARVVVGGHGSDLANLLFCRPGTSVLVLESAWSVAANRHLGLKYLCDVLGLRYHAMITANSGDGSSANINPHVQVNRDYLVDPEELAENLRLID